MVNYFTIGFLVYVTAFIYDIYKKEFNHSFYDHVIVFCLLILWWPLILSVFLYFKCKKDI